MKVKCKTMTGELIFFSILILAALVVFVILVKNKKKKGQKTDTMPNDPAESIFQQLDNL